MAIRRRGRVGRVAVACAVGGGGGVVVAVVVVDIVAGVEICNVRLLVWRR